MNFILDVDGVMSTGQYLYDSNGKTYKIFGPHDTNGLDLIRNKINISFISSDKSGFPISKKKISDMNFNIELVEESERYTHIEKKYGFKDTIFMGDGIFDAPIIKACKFGIAPASARIEAKEAADHVTSSRAAEGAVCDACIIINKKFFGGSTERK